MASYTPRSEFFACIAELCDLGLDRRSIFLLMQSSSLSLNGFSKKFLHVVRLCFPLHSTHKLASGGSLRDDSLPVVFKVLLKRNFHIRDFCIILYFRTR